MLGLPKLAATLLFYLVSLPLFIVKRVKDRVIWRLYKMGMIMIKIG